MISTVALGVICLAGLGAIAAAAIKSPPPPQRPEVVFPMVSGEKVALPELGITELSRDPTAAPTVGSARTASAGIGLLNNWIRRAA
jgi:hypothetical protein